MEYVPHTTERDELTSADVAALAAGDHQRVTPQQFTNRFVADKASRDAEYEQQMLDDYTEGVEQVMRGAYTSGTPNGPSFNCSSPRVGFSNIAQWRWDLAFSHPSVQFKRDWAYGNAGLENETITREQVNEIIKE
jgi:hypothetical protein